MSWPFSSMWEVGAILRHYYGGGHREYPYCPQCVKWNVESLKARLRAKYRKAV